MQVVGTRYIVPTLAPYASAVCIFGRAEGGCSPTIPAADVISKKGYFSDERLYERNPARKPPAALKRATTTNMELKILK